MSQNIPRRSKSFFPPVLVLGSMLMALAAGAADTPRSVTDYYQRIPEKFFSGEQKYELTRSKDGWMTHSPMTGGEISVTVDAKNGYIAFSDDGTGGGDHQVKVALFLKEDKTPLLALSQSDSDGLVFSGSVTFAEPAGNSWNGVNDRVLPTLRPEDFLAPGCLNALTAESKGKLIREGLDYALPRQGTTIRVSARIVKLMLKEEARDEGSPCPKDNPRELKWDKKEGRFTLEPAKPTGKSRP